MKKAHMQFYFKDGMFIMLTFCGENVDSPDNVITTSWDKCTCKKCLKYKESAGKPS